MASITTTSSGAFVDSSFRPSCSGNVVKIEVPAAEGSAAPRSTDGVLSVRV
jgi:hypothetical protein